MSAALAPGSPSGQDMAVAALAAASSMKAMAQMSSDEGGATDAGRTSEIRVEAVERAYANFKSPRGLWSKHFGFETPDEAGERASIFAARMLDIPA
jgi:hypothetical protein